jgi:hypothetical protein
MVRPLSYRRTIGETKLAHNEKQPMRGRALGESAAVQFVLICATDLDILAFLAFLAFYKSATYGFH